MSNPFFARLNDRQIHAQDTPYEEDTQLGRPYIVLRCKECGGEVARMADVDLWIHWNRDGTFNVHQKLYPHDVILDVIDTYAVETETDAP